MLKGTDGTFFSTMVTRDTPLYTFVPDVCRSLLLRYVHDSEVMNIPTYRFEPVDENFHSSESNSPNACYCTRKKCKDWCSGQNGIFDIGPCNDEAPLFASSPHFLFTQPDLNSLVEGLTPDVKFHKTWLDIEPVNAFTKVGNALK